MSIQFIINLSYHTIPDREICSGDPLKDGIPGVDHPGYLPVADADGWPRLPELVEAIEAGGLLGACAIQALSHHKMVNGWLGNLPVTSGSVRNTRIAFDR